jgi:hypothetical protein
MSSIFAAVCYDLLHDELYAEYEDAEDDLHLRLRHEEGVGPDQGRLMPTFLSAPLDITANQGNTLRLPCKVDRLQVCSTI